MLMDKKCRTCGKEIPYDKDVCEECIKKVLEESNKGK